MKGFLNYSEGHSVLHRMNPLIKIWMSLLICISCFLSSSHLFAVSVIVLNLLIAAAGGIIRRAAGMLAALAKLSVVLFLIQVFFIRDGRVILTLPLGLCITDRGLSFSLLMVLRLIAATMPLAIMLSLTRMSDLTNALVEKLGIPFKYAFSLTTAIRFIPVFINDMQDIMEAQKARGVEFDTNNPVRKIGMILPLCVPLMISSVKRIEVSALSAELRGFYSRKRNSGYKRYGLTANDAAALASSFLLLASAILL